MSDEKIEREMEEVEQWARQLVPSATTQRGTSALEARVTRAKHSAQRKELISVRIDRDVLERLRALAGPDGSYQSLLNRALIEWCDAQETGTLLDARLDRLDRLAKKMEEHLQLSPSS